MVSNTTEKWKGMRTRERPLDLAIKTVTGDLRECSFSKREEINPDHRR